MTRKSRKPLSRCFSFLQQRHNLHYLLTASAALSLLPALRAARLPFRWDWPAMLTDYATLAAQSLIAATILYTVEFPAGAVKFLQRLPRERPNLLVSSLFLAALMVATTATTAAVTAVVAVAVFGLWSGQPRTSYRVSGCAVSVLPPAGYLFCGLLLVFSFVNIIVRLRFYALYSPFFKELDDALIGSSVTALWQQLAHVKGVLHPALTLIYYGMFPQVGAGLIFCGIGYGAQRSLQLVGTILFSYYLALLLFYCFPSIGPFLHPEHFNEVMKQAPTYQTQQSLLATADYLWRQRPVAAIPIGYYIGFPCMHIAQPLIVLCYLRRWHRIFKVLFVYDLLLAASILLLEWHYLVDIIGGVLVAAGALLVIGTGAEPERNPAPLGAGKNEGPGTVCDS